ncbi:MAG: ABC transporter permease subunit [Luteimonas sp.]|nr:ABC transporter permease subunit [Luteimonas sp.]
MFFEFFRFELREQLRSPLLWLLAGLFALLGFGAAASDAVVIGGGIGNVNRNAPFVIVQFMALFSIMGMLIVPVFVSSALLRDFDQGTAELIFASPVRKRDYLLGRLSAALLASVVAFVVIALGMFIAQFMPWIDEARLGPVSLMPYLWSFAVIVIPNLLFTCALLALLAILTRSILWVYLGVIGFLVLYGVSAALLRNLDNIWLATLIEPLGIRAFVWTTRYWTVEERNADLPEIARYIGANRALWIPLSLAMFAAAFALFRTERTGTARRRWWRRKPAAQAEGAAPVRRGASVPRVVPAFGAGTTWKQFLHQLRFDGIGVFVSVPFIIMLVFGLANFVPNALEGPSMYGTTAWPVTSQMLTLLQGAYSWLLVIIALFYAGELVWKERAARMHEVTDAMPVANGVPLAAKLLALVGVVFAFQLIGGLASIAIQLAKGYAQVEPLVYLKTLALNSVAFILMGGLALCLQVFTNNKFAGYAALILVMIGQGVLAYLDFTHNLYTFGNWPNAPYSDMNGYGHFLVPQLWFQLYWGVLLLALLLLSAALWVRGVDQGWRHRWTQLRTRMRGGHAAAFAVALLAFAGIGGWLYWNTNVLNDYTTPQQRLDRQARYEREYRQYERLPQPKIVGSRSEVDLRPETQSMTADVVYTVHNPHDVAIPDVHVQMMDDRALASVDLGGAELTRHDEELGYRIYRLDRPMQPGEQREFRFRVDYHPRGITNTQAQTQLVDNGSFFNNALFPSFGYNPRGEIGDRNERRKRDLGEPRRMPKLEDEAARADTYIGDDGDWIEFSTTICTAPDQIALAPGYIEREFERDGRRCFSYAMDRPMLNFHAFLSARWEVRKGTYKDIPIEVYYDPKHPFNVDRMIEATQKSLAYFEEHFTPYQHRQFRIIEFPNYSGSFAQAFANTIPYSEAIGFVADLRDPDAIDYVFYVTAHEAAHQWWAHQVIGANVQGATVLSESLAQYSALMVMEKEYGRQRMRQFLKYELDRYLGGRGGEIIEEQPLYRNENQPYIHYRKGSLVFYRLREEMGDEALNRALKRFLEDKGYQQAPFTTSLELLDYIRAEAGAEQQGLITDLFEKITFYDNRVVDARARKRDDGRYDVTLTLHAAKRHADGMGKETPVELDDWIEVGVFARGPSGKERDEKVLYLERHHVTAGDPVITVTVDELPHEAGFDPYNKLIDRVSGDNRKRVSM